MAYVVSLTGVRPAPRYDSVAWETAIIEEAPEPDGPWAQVAEFALAPLDADPRTPQRRDFTVDTAVSPRDYFRVRFVDPAFNVSYTDAIGVSGYPTTEALVEASPVEELTSLSADQQDALRASSINAIEEFCNQSFTAFSGVIDIESPGGASIWLPRRLREIVSVTPTGGDSYELTTLGVANDGYRLIWKPNVVGVGYYEQALYEVSGGDYPSHFPKDAVLSVRGEWGWSVVPDPVVTAIRYDMEDQALADSNALAATVHVSRKLGLDAISQGNLRVQLGAVASLTPRVMRLLEPYVFLGGGGHLI